MTYSACAQTSGIDLPLKALAWQDASGQVWLGYNDPQYLAARHKQGGDCGAVTQNLRKALDWLPHTVRGAIAGALKKKLGLKVGSEKVADRGRVYRIAG